MDLKLIFLFVVALTHCVASGANIVVSDDDDTSLTTDNQKPVTSYIDSLPQLNKGCFVDCMKSRAYWCIIVAACVVTLAQCHNECVPKT